MTRPDIHAEIAYHLQALGELYAALNARRPTGVALSPRELEVATLLASTPLTNREVGERLYLTEDTVKTHARRAFRKLGIGRRAELAAALAMANLGRGAGGR